MVVDEGNEKAFAFKRILDNHVAFVALNFTADDVEVSLEDGIAALCQSPPVISNYESLDDIALATGGILKLKGYEGRLYISST